MKKIKILISSHSAALHTGLSETQRHIFIPLLQKYKDKYDIHQLGFFNVKPAEAIPWPIYSTKSKNTPRGPELIPEDQYGQQSFNELVDKIKPDIVFGYGDIWHFDHILTSPLRNQYRFLSYYTIDGQPYFGNLKANMGTEWGTKLLRSDEIVVLSHFGKECLERGCPELKNKNIKVMYHPMDMHRFSIVPPDERLKIRDKILPKHISRAAFICGWVGKNQFRKQNYKLWELTHYMVHGDYIRCQDCGRVTIKEWNHTTRSTKDPDKYPGELDKLCLYDHEYRYECCWHCNSKNIIPGIPNPNFLMWFHMSKEEPGYNPDFHERMWNITNNTIFTSNIGPLAGLKSKDLALLISSWDAMYYPSGGEGFGNPAAECLAASTPIVYSDYSSHAEFCRFGGLPVRCTFQPEIANGIQRAIVDTNHAIEQMLKLVENSELRQELGSRGRSHMNKYSIQHMVDVWDQLFTNLSNKPLPIESSNIYTTVL